MAVPKVPLQSNFQNKAKGPVEKFSYGVALEGLGYDIAHDFTI